VILSDREIRAALERGAVRITPPPALEAFSSTAVDLVLGQEVRVWSDLPEGEVTTKVRPGVMGFSVTHLLEQRTRPMQIPSDGFELAPGHFVLGWTAEKVQLPHRSRLAARVEGKSSMARLGLGIHVTAPTIHAGFGYKEDAKDYQGTAIQLEIWNIGKLAIILDVGLPICQLIFEEVHGTPEKGYAGTFASQGPTGLPSPSTRKRRRR